MNRIRTLFVHDHLPRPDQSGSEKRIALLLAELRRQGHAVTYIARLAAGQEAYLPAAQAACERVYASDLERLRYLGAAAEQAPFRLAEILRAGRFELAILTHWYWNGIAVSEHYLGEIRRLAPATRIAILSDDHHGFREARMARLSGAWWDWERARDFEARELEIYGRADLVLAISAADRDGIAPLAPGATIELLPPVAEAAEPGATPFAQRAGILFLGEYLNGANRDGIDWFLAEVWPLVLASRPQTRMSVIGPNWPASYGATANVDLLGALPELDAAFARHRLAICPVRYGTGIKTKNLTALTHGLPFVTTTIGAEGMELRDGVEAAIADEAAAFAGRTVELLEDETAWLAMARAGQAHAKGRFSQAAQGRRLAEALSAALAKAAKTEREEGLVSPLEVEKYCPQVLEAGDGALERRVAGYLSLGERWLAEGKRAAARAQFRHALTFVRDPRHSAMARIEAGLWRCREEPETEYFGALGEDRPRTKRRSVGRAAQPRLSAVIPTHNRRRTLEACLAALERQTLPAEAFEVIVVDDGSSDDTERWCRGYEAPFVFHYLRRKEGGAGAARRVGVEAARGEYVWLANDDTIATPGLLAAHAAAWQRHAGEKLAILGDFRYPFGASRRALTHALQTQPILFPQAGLAAGARTSYSHFVTCNLSLARAAIEAAGNFDGRFAVGEDTELGARLEDAGYAVLYEPAALAWHEHLQIRARDLVERARCYGPANRLLYELHPRKMGGGWNEAAQAAAQEFVVRRRREVEEAVHALERYDDLELAPLFARADGSASAADRIAALFATAIPAIHRFYVYESLLAASGEAPARVTAEAV